MKMIFCGLQEIVRGRSLDSVLDRLPDIWGDLFRVMDDIKESVRVTVNIFHLIEKTLKV